MLLPQDQSPFSGLLDAPLEAGPSDLGFYVGLYLEHLEEASFLYEQRLALLDDPELTWIDLEDFEERVEAHLDALVLGGDLALAVCRQQAAEGDFGEAYAAVCIFCRQDRRDLVEEVREALDPEDEDRVRAVEEALWREWPTGWTAALGEMLGGEAPAGHRLAARIAGFRRLGVGATLAGVLPAVQGEARAAVIWSLGRLRESQVRVPLYERYLQGEDEAVRAAAALALLRLGEPQAGIYCVSLARSQPWTLLPLGLGGGAQCVPLLLEIATSGQANDEALFALGLLGHSAAVEPLLGSLGHDVLAEAAATALELITGAGCYEDVFIPDEVDEDTLFEDEAGRLQRGEPLTPPGEAPPGTTLRRLSQDPAVWQAWWADHQDAFRPGVRYRYGQAYAPAVLLASLQAEETPRRVRQWASEELVIRYGLDVSFETDLLVAAQRQALAQCAAWVQATGASFEAGRWYFAGRPSTW